MTVRELVDKKFNTKDLTDLSEFNISLDSVISIAEEYNKLKSAEDFNDGYIKGCEDTNFSYKHNI